MIRDREKPVLMTIEEWKWIEEIAQFIIRMHLAENVYFSMAKETTLFELWEKLQAVYEKQSSSSKLILIQKLFNMKMKETDPATSHINTFKVWIAPDSRLSFGKPGSDFEEEVKSLTLFSSLPAVGSGGGRLCGRDHTTISLGGRTCV